MLAHFAGCEALAGATVGKRVLGLRVVDQAGDPIGWPVAAVRNLLRITDVGLLSIVMALRSSEHRKLGDRVAGTIVVRVDRPD